MENKVLAIVEGSEIYTSDVELYMQQLGQRAAQFNNDEGRAIILDELIHHKLFLADAKANNLDDTDMFKVELEKLKDSLMIQIMVNQTLMQVQASDDEINEHYENNKEKYASPEEASASHILVKDEKECLDIYQEIIENKISFEDAAKKYSTCPSKENGGSLGFFARGRMVPEFEKAAFALKKGEISTPIQSQFGFHIIRLDDKKAPQTKAFDEVKEQIQQEIVREKQKDVYSSKIEELKAKYNIEKK